MATLVSCTAQVEGLRIAYDAVGRGEPPVVLIHGAFTNRAQFAAQVEHLAAAHRVVALDLRGHGDSDVPAEGFSLADFARDVIGVCEVAGIADGVLCGHSIGGAVALEVAATRPDLGAGIVLIDAAILYPEAMRTVQLDRFLPLLEGPRRIEVLRRFFGAMLGPYDSPDLKTALMAQIAAAPPHMVVPVFRLIAADFAAQLAAVRQPLLYIHAVAPTDLARLRVLRPDALVAAVAGSGHYPMLEVPDQVNAMLDRFLAILAMPRGR